MLDKRWFKMVLACAMLALLVFPGTAGAQPLGREGQGKVTVTVLASGLDNPRGLAFSPNGQLYVAEAGLGGTQSTVGQCEQVPFAGPYTGSPTGSRISRIDKNGNRTIITDQFPSSETAPAAGSFVSGVADIAFIGQTMYAVTAGSGCSHGVAGTTNGIYRVGKDGSLTLVADLSAFQKANPVAHPNPGDFEPDGTWYSLAAYRGALYAVEPNHGELDKITQDGKITRISDISASQGHIVPTAFEARGGAFYVGNLDDFPAKPDAKILRIDLQGNIEPVATGLTAVLGVAFDKRGRLYALETSAPATDPNGPPVLPGTGRVVRLTSGGQWETVVSGLTFPTAMMFGPDGNLYVSNFGFFFGPAAGKGQILRITMHD